MRTSRVFWVVAGVLLSGVVFAQPRTFVSAATGSDANPCSRLAPCRNFAAAVAVTTTGGEVIVLDSGGYGVVVIDKPISLISPTGIYAGITVTVPSSDGIRIGEVDDEAVVIRGLTINGQGASVNGIKHLGNAKLYVENCVLNRLSGDGIIVDLTSQGSLFVKDTIIRNTSFSAIRYRGSGSATIDHCHLEGSANSSGVRLESGVKVTVRNTVAAGGLHGYGVFADGGQMDIEDSVAVNNSGDGFWAAGGVGNINLERCRASGNLRGVFANGYTIRVSNSTITNNATGVAIGIPTGFVISRQNNTLENNGAGNSFTDTYTAQ